ncbi:MAG: exosortase/archaeosortase family protein [Phycisphaerae bacterium]|nr:exosortase/archaeosortase family protein [Phycisphaerae bacterium]
MEKKSGKTGSNPKASTGSLAEMVYPDRAVGFVESLGRNALIKIAVLGVLLVAVHFKLLDVMVRRWITDSNWTHGFIIPLFSLYLLYMRRGELFEARRKICFLGLALVLLAMVAEVVAVLRIHNHWLAQMSMVVMLIGLVLYLGGISVIRVIWLPILFLLFALPIPELLYSRLAVPLQDIAASGAVMILEVLGVEITSTASALDVISRSGVTHGLTVAEACSGMRLLMAFCALGVAMAYLDYKPIWQRLILVAAAVPIAVFCNVIRVAITCWMYYIDEPEMGQGFMHTFAGILMLLPAFAMLWALSWVLRHIIVEEHVEAGS